MNKESDGIVEHLATWGFKHDPFGESYPYDQGFWAGPDEEISYLKYLLRDRAKTEGSILNIFLKGEYGTGKTYTLKSLQAYVTKDLGGLAIYFRIPSKQQLKGFRDVFGDIVSGIGVEGFKEVGKQIISENNLQAVEDLAKFLERSIQNDDLRKALANIVFDQDFALTWSWLLGETTVHQQRSLGFLSSMKDEALELSAIAELLDFLVPYKKFVVVLIDELENLVGESQTIRSIREGFRNLYDELNYSPRKGSVAIITSATIRYLFEVRDFLGTAMEDRIDQEIAIKPLQENEVVAFVGKLFQWARESDDSSLIPKPFKDQAAVDAFVSRCKSQVEAGEEFAKGLFTRRKVIKAGKELFWKACFHSVPQIDSEFVNRHLPLSVLVE